MIESGDSVNSFAKTCRLSPGVCIETVKASAGFLGGGVLRGSASAESTMMGSGRGGGGLSSRFAASFSDKLLRRLDGLRRPCPRLLDDRDEARSGLTLGLFLL